MNYRMLVVWFDAFCVYYTFILLALMLPGRGQSAVIGPIQPVVATVGDDIILPCYLYPTMDASDMTVEWTRPDLESRLVHVRPERAELQNPSYKGRPSLFIDELKRGNISLKISKVKLSDEGTYRCFVPDLQRDSAVRLVVGAASSPVAQMNRTSSRVVLQCESAGWYPEPELLWLDAEGNLLSAGPTETLRGPDDLYTVSSRVTVEKRHSNNITCRVQQKDINQSRETHIHVPVDFFMVISPTSPPSDPTIDSNTIIGLAIGAVVVLILILAVFCVVWKRRRVRCRKMKKSTEDRLEQMMDSENDNLEFHVVVEEGESEPLMERREEEDDVVSRGEQRHEEERKTKQDQFVLETEQIKENPQEKRINPSAVLQKESLITIEKETKEDVTGTEEEDDVESRGEKNFKEERETQQDETETEQRRDADEPGTNTSMTETESQIKMKQETHEEQDVIGRQERNDVGSRGEQSNKDERETKDHQEELKEGLRRSEEERIDPFILTETESQSTAGQETDEEQEMRGRGMKAEGAEGEREKMMEGGKDYSGLQFFPLTEEHKEQPVLVKEAKPFNLISHLNTDQKTWREKETQKEQLVERRQRERHESRKTSDSEKKRSEEERSELFKAQKKTRQHQREKLLTERRKKNQKKKQSETRMERETDVKIRKSKNQHHKEETQERNEEESENEKHGEENQRDRMGMTERKTEEQRNQEENMNSSVSSKVTANTDLKTQEKEPEEKSEQSPEEIREQPVFLAGAESFNFTFHLNTDQKPWREKEKQQPEKQRRAQSEGGGQREMMKVNEGVTSDGTNRKEREKLQLRHEGALQEEQQENVDQKEEPEEPVSVTERGVDCLEEPQKEALMEVYEALDVDQHNIQSRKRKQEIKLHEVCNLPAKKQKIQEARKHQNVRKVKMFVKKLNDDHMKADDAAHSQYAAITQQHETMKWTKEQQMLSEQKETQEYLKEHNDDQMEVEERSGLQFPPFTEEHKEQPVLLAGAEPFDFTFHLKTDQEAWREKEAEQPEKQRRAQSERGGQREMMEINEEVTSDGTNRKEREKLQLICEGVLKLEQQDIVNQKEELEEPVSVTERGVDCLEEPQKKALMGINEAPDVDLNNINKRKQTQELELHEVCKHSVKKQKIQ